MTDAPRRADRNPTSLFAILVALAAFAVAVAAIVTQSGGSAGGSSSSGKDLPTGPVSATLAEWKIELDPTSHAPGEIEFNISNAGTMEHDLSIEGLDATSPKLEAGKTISWNAGDVPAGTYAVFCTIPGHREQGMETKLTVGGASGGGASGGTSGETASSGAKIDASATPGPAFTAKDPKAPATPTGTVHDVTFEAREAVVEVAPGVTQEMWTFNQPGEETGFPGPTLRGKIGDTFRVTIVNKGSITHSMDFHASMVAWSDEMGPIEPGAERVYEFTANHSGIFMYHCGTAPVLMHIGSGMYGAVIIDPPNLAPVDYEYVFVQSELYLGPEGGNADLQKMLNDKWDAVVFNGYFNQYTFQPVQVEPNKRIRVWVMNDGPTNSSAWHVIGTIFDTSFFEGNYLLQPSSPTGGGSQALGLQPAQGGFVEFELAEEGYYPFVTHRFSDTGKGAMGLFRAGDPPPLDAAAEH